MVLWNHHWVKRLLSQHLCHGYWINRALSEVHDSAKISESTEWGLNLQTGIAKFQAVLANWVCIGPYTGVRVAESRICRSKPLQGKGKEIQTLCTRLQTPHQLQLGNTHHLKFICKQNIKGEWNWCIWMVSRKITHLNLTWCSRTWKQKNLMWSSLEKKTLLLEAIWYIFCEEKNASNIWQIVKQLIW